MLTLKKIAKIITILTISTICLLHKHLYVSASGKTNDDIERVIKEYRENNLEYQKITLDMKLYEIKQKQYDKGLLTYENQISDCIDTDAKQRLIEAYEDCLREKVINSFYVNNESLIKEAQNSLIYNMLSKYLQLSVYNKQMEYYKSQKKLLKAELETLKKSYQLGYCAKIELLQKKMEYSDKESQISSLEGEQNKLKKFLILNVGNQPLEPLVNFALNDYLCIEKAEVYEEQFKNKSYISGIDQQITAYQVYRDNCKLRLTNFNIVVETSENMEAVLTNKRNQYVKNCELWSVACTDAFYKSKQNYIEKQKQLEVANESKAIKTKLYKKGKIRKTQLYEAEVLCKKLEYESYVNLYQLNCIYYQLFYLIDNPL